MGVSEFDIVKNHFDEIGIVRKVETNKLWGNMIYVEIINSHCGMHELGEMAEHKPENLKVVKKLHF